MFKRACKIDRNCCYALTLAGHEYLMMDSIDEALKLFREAIDISPNEWSSWYGLATVHFRKENYMISSYYIDKAIDINPDCSVLYYISGLIRSKLGNEAEAIKSYDLAISYDPENLVAIYQKGVLLYELGKENEALELLKHIESLLPYEATMAFTKGKIAKQLGRNQEASIYFSQAIGGFYPNRKEILSFVDSSIEEIIHTLIKKQ